MNDNEEPATTSKRTKAHKKPLPNEIKCVLIQGYGTVKQMKCISIPRPKPGDGEVLVHVKSCGVNFQDLSIRQGNFADLPKLPFVPGFECAGEIVQLGPNTSGFSIGERVICLPRFCGWSEYLVINCNLIYKIPPEISFREAAALSYSYLTAYILLFELGGVKSGQTVLFHSAGGAVGIALTQLCKLVPNLKTIATCSKAKFEVLNHHITYLVEENGPVDYVQEAKK
jgi:NADPH:quinone reductase-like Zn-dependent oxidoreductase